MQNFVTVGASQVIRVVRNQILLNFSKLAFLFYRLSQSSDLPRIIFKNFAHYLSLSYAELYYCGIVILYDKRTLCGPKEVVDMPHTIREQLPSAIIIIGGVGTQHTQITLRS